MTSDKITAKRKELSEFEQLIARILTTGRCKEYLDSGSGKYPNNFIEVNDVIKFVKESVEIKEKEVRKEFLDFLESILSQNKMDNFLTYVTEMQIKYKIKELKQSLSNSEGEKHE